ncbi:MAG: WG repeat-containing protein [Cyclobacteriaceae bacterium]
MKRGMIFVIGWLMFHQLCATQYKIFQENGKVGLKDDNNQVVLPASFDALGWSDGNFSVIGNVTGYRVQGLWGIINLEKKFLTKAEYENLEYAGGELVVVRKKINSVFYKSGCLNLKGETKIPLIYDGVKVHGLRAIIFNLTSSGYRYGLSDLNHKILLPAVYKSIMPLGSLRYAVENKEGKVALYSEDGKAITDFVIDSVSAFNKNYAHVYQNQLQGLIGRDGLTKLETKYNAIKITEEGKILAQLPNEWLFINEKNETIKQFFADELKSISGKNFFVKKGSHWGIVDENFNELVPAHYESISELETQKFLVRSRSKLGVIDSQNKIVIPFYFDSLTCHGNVFLAFEKARGWQLVNHEGKTITNRFYEKLKALDNQNFIAKSKGYFGIVNAKGQEFVHCVFDSTASPKNGLIAVKFKGSYGIINEDEDWVVAPQNFKVSVINANLYLQYQPDNQFIKSFDGRIIYFTPYQLKFEKENFVETLPNGIEKTIDYNGLIVQRTITPTNTEEVFRESEGYRGIKKDGRYGFVDSKGKLRIANRYDSIGEFHEGLASVKLIGKWGFVNTEDRVAINPNYDRPAIFKSGIAIVSRNNKFGLIGRAGNVILPLRYDKIDHQQNSFRLALGKLHGMTDDKGNAYHRTSL